MGLLCVILVGLGGCAAGSGGTLADGVDMTSENNLPGNAGDGGTSMPAPAPYCATPGEGCPCDHEGEMVQCPGPKIHTGNYTSCPPGERTCTEGVWGPCVSKAVYQSSGSLTQDYVSPCAPGERVRWGALTLDGLAPEQTRIRVSVQTSQTASALDTATIVAVGQFEGTTRTSWTSADVDNVLTSGGHASQEWLRVTVDLAASQAGVSPAVVQWRQASTCVAAP